MDITFPVIEISDSSGFFVVNKLADSCNALGWKNGYFHGLCYFDAEERLWPVSEAKLSKPIGFLDKILNRKLGVKLKLGDPLPNGMDLAKTKLASLVDDDPDDLYNQFVTRKELKVLIKRARSSKELIDVASNLGAS